MNLNIKRLLSVGFGNALGVFLYTLSIAWLMQNLGQAFNPDAPPFLQLLVFLMLLVLSVVIIGLFIFGWPILLYLQGHKKAAVSLMLSTVGSLFLLTLLAVALNMAR